MEEATRIKFEAIEQENDRQNHRLSDLEEQMKKLHEIATSIEKMNINIQHLCEEMKSQRDEMHTQSERITKMENMPGETMKNMRQSAINTTVGVIVGALVVAALQMIVKYL